LAFTDTSANSYAYAAKPAVRTDRSFTVMAWVYLTDLSSSHGILSQPGKVSSGFILLYDKPSDSWRLVMPRTDTVEPLVDGPSSVTKPALRTWTHLAAIFDDHDDTVTLFVNGIAEAYVKHPVSWNATGSVQVARSWYDGAWTDRFAGRIDDLRIYSRAVTPKEISAIAHEAS
jgi:hypothetical protein